MWMYLHSPNSVPDLARGKTADDIRQVHFLYSFPRKDNDGRTIADAKTTLPQDSFALRNLKCSPEVKYIYVTRHPADCLVSYYHHTRHFPTYFFSNGTLDEFFELFHQGDVPYNDYFDHLLSAYKYINEPNVLIITYESLVADRRGVILKIARFLGEEYYRNLVDNNEEVLNKVVEYSSLDFMKSTVNGFWSRRYCKVTSIAEQESSLEKAC
ncbi:sulfotransferase 1C4 [Trichonephila clavipes]|nr:sulfotransferase 1C4 [Trichonephila clavipes]